MFILHFKSLPLTAICLAGLCSPAQFLLGQTSLALPAPQQVATAQSAPAIAPSPFERVLASIPETAEVVIAIPDLAQTSDDVEQCLTAMNRPESVLAGKPVDQLKALLGVSTAFDEQGGIALYGVISEGALAYAMLVPADDPAAFIGANLAPVDGSSGGEFQFRDERVHARAIGGAVLISKSKQVVDSYAPGDGIGTRIKTRVGDRGWAIATGADLAMWASQAGLELSRPKEDPAAPAPANLKMFDPILKQASDLLVGVDVDPLAVVIRPLVIFSQGTDLAQLSSVAIGSGSGASLGRLPAAMPYFAFCASGDSAGGCGPIIEWLGKFEALAPLMPAWLKSSAGSLKSLSVAAYPSKLGLLAGGFMNDSAIVLETSDPAAAIGLFQSEILGMEGIKAGVRQEPSWEDARTLKDGAVASAFEVKTTPLGPSEAPDADTGGAAAQQMIRQVLLGPRGLHGFAHQGADSLTVTMSQRLDVFSRAKAASAGSSDESLKQNATVHSMSQLFPANPSFVGFIWLGQIAKAAKQLTSLMGGGAAMPEIPAKLEPVALGVALGGGRMETALVVPTPVIAVILSQTGFEVGQTKREP